jgi:hypothetical protein
MKKFFRAVLVIFTVASPMVISLGGSAGASCRSGGSCIPQLDDGGGSGGGGGGTYGPDCSGRVINCNP